MAYNVVRKGDLEASNSYVSDLETKSTDAQNISKSINDFISNSRSKLRGDVYNAFRNNLEVYKIAYDKLSQLCSTLSESIETINNGYIEYVDACPDDDPVNARDHIPKYEQRIKDLELEIMNLEEKNKLLATVPAKRFAGYNEKTGLPEYEDNEPQYTDAQNAIVANNIRIAECKAEIIRLKELINYLKRLDAEVDPWAVNSIDAIKTECEKFAKDVDSINVTKLV